MVSRVVQMAIVGSVTLAGCLTVAPPGFLRNGRHTLYRGWIDVNTLGAPAAFFEEVEHLPYSAERVSSYRWMYNRGPGPGLPSGAHRDTRGFVPIPRPGAVPPAPPVTDFPRLVAPEWDVGEPVLVPPPPAP
jgi:hypothetical protein